MLEAACLPWCLVCTSFCSPPIERCTAAPPGAAACCMPQLKRRRRQRLATPQAAVHSPIVIWVMMANTKDSTYVVAPYTQPG